MATGMGPSSSGSQATVASVVTSTLLAGLGFSGGGISSFPSSVWPTRLPTAAASSKQAGRPVVTATEAAAAASPGPERDSALTKDGEGAEEGEKDEKSESEDGEREHEEEEEKDAEKKEKTRVTAAAEAHNSTEPSVAAASPNRTAEEEGNKTISGEEPNQNVAPTAGGPEEESFAEGDAQPQPLPSTQVPPAFTNELYLGKIPRRPETTRKPPQKEDRFPEEYPSDNKFITINPADKNSSSMATRPSPGKMEWIIPLIVVSALTFVCLILLIAVLVYW
ncbi:PREDICTED: receptor-type tyrosine-protein phosphatase gamma-like, partial [Buceros rhinoceros silvestris]|uniref:receptor-type tyrosine-protein phosphatase gamma-like n=1 Tax=Buceros rhinoceros silvestris TaxID=175836 RepID=UPI000528DF1C